jgi:hypothetical protein
MSKRSEANLQLAALQGDVAATKIRLERVKEDAMRLAGDLEMLLRLPPFETKAEEKAGA